MSSHIVPDCLVLKIEEHDMDTYELDNTVFIFYDSRNANFVIRGKRCDVKGEESATYSFSCGSTSYFIDFLTTVVCKQNLWSYVLYNYDNLSEDSNNVTYEFLKDNEFEICELGGYDKNEYSRKVLKRYLNVLKNVYNKY